MQKALHNYDNSNFCFFSKSKVTSQAIFCGNWQLDLYLEQKVNTEPVWKSALKTVLECACTWEVVEDVEGEGDAGGLRVAQGRFKVT